MKLTDLSLFDKPISKENELLVWQDIKNLTESILSKFKHTIADKKWKIKND